MTGYDVFLLCSVLLGIGLFFTSTWTTMHLTLHRIGSLEEGGSLWRTAAFGAGVGIVGALMNSSVQSPLQYVGYVIASAIFLVHGRTFVLAAKQVMANPVEWEVNRLMVAFWQTALSKDFEEKFDSPEKLQAYLDRTYGKGKVDAKMFYRQLGEPKNKKQPPEAPAAAMH